MEMATPGNESATSSRLMAKAPATPEASATTRSIMLGETRAVICELVVKEITPG